MSPDALKQLRDWFIRNAAELPWRPLDVNAPRDPYAVWISETMLQQTQVSTVRDYFTRWMNRFPDVATLAAAEEEEVFKYWQGLGYYSRARNILKTAKFVVETASQATKTAVTDCSISRKTKAGRSFSMPSTRKELEALPGIGAYTAGAILSLAYHQPEAILDGNLVRVFSRVHLLNFLPTDKEPAKDGTGKKVLHSGTCAEVYWNYARDVASHPKGFLHNEALMELGRTICKVKNPTCEKCPLQKECGAFAAGKVAMFPPAKKHLQKDWHGTVLVIESSDHKIFAIHGGQKFFGNQFALPHFESPKNATVGVPAEAAQYLPLEFVENLKDCGSFKHNITVHKMDCQVLYIKIAATALQVSKKQKKLLGETPTNAEFRWIEKARVQETLANSFSLKALQQVNL